MSRLTPPTKDLRTLGYVLRRTDYAEADRVLNIITPNGKISAIAKGVRKPRSKLAGGVEMFTLTDYNLHFGKGDLAVVTGAKMLQHHSGILKDFARMELAGTILKSINTAAETSDSPDLFKIVKDCLTELAAGTDLSLIASWFRLNLLKSLGEELNLYRDATGAKLQAAQKYRWDFLEEVFRPDPHGDFGSNEIKMLRLLWTTDLSVAKRIAASPELLTKIADFSAKIRR